MAKMTTDAITFDCRKRLRRHRGQERNFDATAMAAVINSPAVQERVASGDMLGYYGHLPRVLFGMDPGEAGLLKDRIVPLEPAVRTTRLTCTNDGVITHVQEFLDNPSGRMAQRVHGNKAGGFSSAICCDTVGGKAVPRSFHGFDFVFEPNFSGNRGYLLDGVFDAPATEAASHAGQALDSAMSVMDAAVAAVAAERDAMLRSAEAMYATLQADFDRLLDNAGRLQRENAELLDFLARRPQEQQQAMRVMLASLDAAGKRPAAALPTPGRKVAGSIAALAGTFDAVRLEPRERDEAPGKASVVEDGAGFLGALGIRLG